MQNAVGQIQQLAGQFMQQARTRTLAEIQAKQRTNVIVPPRPRVVRMDSQRVNGRLVAVPIRKINWGVNAPAIDAEFGRNRGQRLMRPAD